MVITCPSCNSRYRIDPKGARQNLVRVKCPNCQNLFQLSLDAHTDGQPAGPAFQVATDVAGKPKVLVVDDAKFFRELIQDLLKPLPVELLAAATGDEAWQIINAVRPQLVLLDINIPGRSGKDVLRELRSKPELDQVKVVIMSAVERGADTALEMRHAGAVDFINKSFKPQELESRVRKILGL